MEKPPTDLNEYRKEKFESAKQSVEAKVEDFLKEYSIRPTSVELVWDQDSDVFQITFTLQEKDTGEVLLTGEKLHQDLITYLAPEHFPELVDYTINPYCKAGYISFIKE